ncbi:MULTISPECIES: hypothetical protein [Halorussus]|uniref:hypothetical protein n=1 Tax=Halorussus TaxID=1070314 RepID=UPI000E21791F|nr:MULTISPECIES: hypothetical protein [Halorussus]NHN58427.1 hypothetical protein [Halorussus sp. JP-T4]
MSEYRDRIDDLAARARADRRAFDPPADPPDEERAVAYLRDGVGDVVSVYVEARTGEFAPLDADEMEGLERALNDWLALYARCHGRAVDPELTVREVAETVVMDTYDLVDAARIHTGVPGRDG